MAIDPGNSSRFGISAPIVLEDGQETFGLMKRFRFLDRNNLNDDLIGRFIVTPGFAGRVDLLADEIYRDVRLHWVLIIFNNIMNPFGWPLNNQVVEFPIPDVVFPEL